MLLSTPPLPESLIHERNVRNVARFPILQQIWGWNSLSLFTEKGRERDILAGEHIPGPLPESLIHKTAFLFSLRRGRLNLNHMHCFRFGVFLLSEKRRLLQPHICWRTGNLAIFLCCMWSEHINFIGKAN